MQHLRKNAKILQIDIDPAEMNKNVMIDLGLVGDIKAVLKKMNEHLTAAVSSGVDG